MVEIEELPDIERRVYLERVRIFFQQAFGSQARTAVTLFFVGLSLYYADVPLWRIGVWASMFLIVIAALAAVDLRYRHVTLTLENAKTWANMRVALGVATGIMLGSGAFLLPPQGHVVSELMIFIVLLAAVSMTCIAYTTMPAYYLGLAFTGMGLLGLSFLRAQDHIHFTFVAMVLISQLVLLKKALDASRTAIEAIRVNENLKIEVERRHEAERAAHIARDVALEASSAKSDFLANMSHELRTPMNAVIGFSGALRSGIAGQLNDKQAEYVGDIQNSGEHLLALINDLLDLSRIEAGKLEIRPETFDLPEHIDQCLPMVRRQAEGGGVAIDVALATDMPTIHADRRLIGQAIVNLLSNAIKFSPQGGRVTIAAKGMPCGGFALSVADGGAGIPTNDIPRVVLPFEQTELGRMKDGAGLGLPLVKRIAELHGGEFALESALGEGTVATISLPVNRVVAGNGLSEGKRI